MEALIGVLGIGLLLGVKHATEVDHVAAVSAIVSEQGSLRRALRIGGLWGAGHTVSILLAGLAVLGLHLAIPGPLARILEMAVAVMIIALGGRALALALRGNADAHVHRHAHGGREHAHLHFHDADHRHAPGVPHPAAHEGHAARIGLRPLLVGMVHGLAGSAALTLLVLAHIGSAPLGLLYLLVFGIGSTGGMAIMSAAIGIPFAATKFRPALQRGIRLAAGALSLGFGLFHAWSQLGGAGG
jgi:ABC-type nickel/cobalt efflux system permease component RcnA